MNSPTIEMRSAQAHASSDPDEGAPLSKLVAPGLLRGASLRFGLGIGSRRSYGAPFGPSPRSDNINDTSAETRTAGHASASILHLKPGAKHLPAGVSVSVIGPSPAKMTVAVIGPSPAVVATRLPAPIIVGASAFQTSEPNRSITRTWFLLHSLGTNHTSRLAASNRNSCHRTTVPAPACDSCCSFSSDWLNGHRQVACL